MGSKSIKLVPDIVEYQAGASEPLYHLIIGKQTLHDIGAVLDFKEKTITIDSILLPMRNIVNLQIKPSVRILDAKYDKDDLTEIVRTSCPHLTPSQRDMLFSSARLRVAR